MSESSKENVSTRASRQAMHPLLRYDPHILDGGIQLLKLEYFENSNTKAPVPRNQEVPKEAFGELTGRSILVATSHAWFHQCHPDPEGVKLDILRKDFFPRLRKRYPYTQILIFDDWHSCPQWPRRTKEENDNFKKCMDHMNSMYCYCDVVLFVEANLPTMDETIFRCDLVPSEHEWLHLIDTIQYLGGEKATTIQKNDIVVGMNDMDKDLDVNTLKGTKKRTIVSFLRRPYGRPNRTPAGERGWLYAERITVAIRMAAAKPSTIVPFEAIVNGTLTLIVIDILFGAIKFIPVRDERSGQTKRWAMGTWLHMPASHRFDLKARAAVKRGIQTTQFTVAYAGAYPVLGGLFFQSNFVIQACLIPVFFILRAGFEYGVDAITSQTFGSDGMPTMNFFGVLMHEICLSVMITSIKHPLVFVSLVLSDVLENSFCLWSLARNTKKSNRVSPKEGEEYKMRKKSLTRRPSNVVSLVRDESNLSDQGTALFIAATLLQREVVETLVPMQAAAILTLLHKIEVKSNGIVNGWADDDWTQTMAYIGIDLGVEVLVFAGTIAVLHRIYPEFDAARILRGLLRMHWVEMTMVSIVIWFANLLYQSTYSGVDMTMTFTWLKCKDEVNSTWLGGFKWEC